MQHYLYRRGNGNEGNFIKAIITLKDEESPYAALRAFVINDYIPGKRVRKHIIRTIEIEGEKEYKIYATVYEGPDNETEFGSAYLTAEFEPLDDEDYNYYIDHNLYQSTPKKGLDRGAFQIFKKHSYRPVEIPA